MQKRASILPTKLSKNPIPNLDAVLRNKTLILSKIYESRTGMKLTALSKPIVLKLGPKNCTFFCFHCI